MQALAQTFFGMHRHKSEADTHAVFDMATEPQVLCAPHKHAGSGFIRRREPVSSRGQFSDAAKPATAWNKYSEWFKRLPALVLARWQYYFLCALTLTFVTLLLFMQRGRVPDVPNTIARGTPIVVNASPMVIQPTLLLPGGGHLPMMGLGLCCPKGELARRSVLSYLLLGGRHLDTSELYGNHKAVGDGLRQAMEHGVPRSEVFLTTKIPPGLFGYRSTISWAEQMLNELGVDYVDLVLLHGAWMRGRHRLEMLFSNPRCWALGAQKCRGDTWLALQQFQRAGRIRDIGVSNFGPRQIGELMALKGSPVAANQLEYHPWAPEPHRLAVEFCHRNDIAVIAYVGGGAPMALAKEGLERISKKYGKTIRQLLIRWTIQRNVSTIVGTTNPDHMKENMDVFDFQLSSEEMAVVSATENRASSHLHHVPDKLP